MARNVRIATLSGKALPVEAGTSPAEVLERMQAHWEERFLTVGYSQPDLILLPENCDRPSVHTFPEDEREAYYEYRGDQMRDFFAAKAREFNANIGYSARRHAGGEKYNSTQFLDRRGEVVGVYDKAFLTTGEYERVRLKVGEGAKLINLDFGTVAPAICFDLNFGELLADVAALHPDLVAFSSVFHGGYLQAHWAYETRAYFVGSIYPPNRSEIRDPFGDVIATSTNYRDEVVTSINLDSALIHIDFNGVKFNDVRKKYGPAVRIHDPGRVGAVQLTAEADDLTVDEVIEDCGLVRLDDYFARVRTFRPQKS